MLNLHLKESLGPIFTDWLQERNTFYHPARYFEAASDLSDGYTCSTLVLSLGVILKRVYLPLIPQSQSGG